MLVWSPLVTLWMVPALNGATISCRFRLAEAWDAPKGPKDGEPRSVHFGAFGGRVPVRSNHRPRHRARAIRPCLASLEIQRHSRTALHQVLNIFGGSDSRLMEVEGIAKRGRGGSFTNGLERVIPLHCTGFLATSSEIPEHVLHVYQSFKHTYTWMYITAPFNTGSELF